MSSGTKLGLVSESHVDRHCLYDIPKLQSFLRILGMFAEAQHLAIASLGLPSDAIGIIIEVLLSSVYRI